MPSYKLTYFDGRGLAEAARQLFYLGGVEFEDVRIPMAALTDGTWDELKKKTPFGQVPVLSVDGFEIPQSGAIIRYLARKFGFAGKTPEDQAWVDAIFDQFKDFNGAFRQMIMAQRAGKPADEVEKIKKEVSMPARDVYFKILNGLLEKSTSGWLAGDELTFADLVVVDNLQMLEDFGFFSPAEQPKLVALRKKVHGHEKLEKYIANRPVTQF